MNGAELIAKVLVNHGIKNLYTLSGGHIAPIFVEAKRAGIRIVDVRHEVNSVFAADAEARMTGIPGVATVTAGPGVTNTITAIKNAQMAQSPLILLGGAAATILKGRGSLQDIDQLSLMKSLVKWAVSVKKVKDYVPTLEKAFRIAMSGVPGPVFVECPIDTLYQEDMVREWYSKDTKNAKGLVQKAMGWYINNHLNKVFEDYSRPVYAKAYSGVTCPEHSGGNLQTAALKLKNAKRPVIVIGSQGLLKTQQTMELVEAIEKIGAPVYLSGMARGLLGPKHHLQYRHKRTEAIKEADLVLLAGVPCDFRLNYGLQIKGNTYFIAVNRSVNDLTLNKRPNLGILSDPSDFLIALGKEMGGIERYNDWHEALQVREDAREADIDKQAAIPGTKGINPVQLFRELDPMLDNNSVLVADGGDFVGTASYTLKPRRPLSWLDPGAFGTLGVGGGFALGAKLVRPDAEVWIIWGDGSSAYSLAEFDTYARLGIPVIGLIGNDAAWAQIARDQVELLGDDVASQLAYSDYHLVAKGYGGDGVKVDNIEDFKAAVKKAKESVKAGKPFVINAILGKSDFRKGSISV
jgi:thiamine pyrophosphate-dependent acetolactate synthase large subunit-like protein